MTISNEIPSSAFVSNPEIRIMAFPSPPIELKSKTSPEIRYLVHKPGKTLTRGLSNTLTVCMLPRDSEIGDWRLKSIILVQIRTTRKEWLATTWLEGIAEYGVGEGGSEAIIDLVVSLGEYRESLEKREVNLGDSARRELDYLRRLIERRSINNLT